MCGGVRMLFILVNVSLFSSTYSSVLPSSVRHKRQSSCKNSEFRCNSGECIPSFNVCDGAKDCSDTSDETRSVCRNGSNRCPSKSFKCAYGACIDQVKKCDGSPDCMDGSDEVNCKTSCGVAKFKCKNGECINLFSTCDGPQDCSDGSDETQELCKNLLCPTNTFKCDYGACLAKQTRCNGKADCHDNSDERGCPGSTSTSLYQPESVDEGGSCRLPAHPAHGVYQSVCPAGDRRTACRNQPGTPVPDNWLLKYSCNDNYDLTSTAQFSVCDSGVWNNPLDCIKLCLPLKSLSVDVHCELNGRQVPCDQPMKPNTRAYASCKQHYQLQFQPEYSYLICRENGEWSYRLFYCVPDCGVSIKGQVQTLILNGDPTEQGEYPWLVALYGRNSRNKWEQNCAGTLINPHIVLTAAHCLVSKEGVKITPNDIKVGLGKYWRDYNKNENYSLIANVREVLIPKDYAGGSTHFALDIGLLDLAQSVVVTAFIMPVCVDWGSTYTLTNGDVGHVAGWGTTENDASSDTVLSANMSYIDNAACVKQVRQVLKRLVTHDKFCAAGINGGQVDHGDSGGGLTVVKKGQHFVFGVVSTKITEEKELRLFTDITNAQHHVWLNTQRTALDQYHSDAQP